MSQDERKSIELTRLRNNNNLNSLESTSSHESSVSESDNEQEFEEGGLTGYLVVIGLFFGLIVNLGIINSIGAIETYVSSHQLESIKTTSISWIFSIYLALAYAIALFTGPIFDRHGTLVLLCVSTGLIFMGLMATANCTKVWQFILSFIVLGIGNGLGMTPLVGVISHWFIRKRGSCMGIASSGGSVGGLIFPLLLRHLYEVYDFIWAVRIMAFFCLGCMIISIVLVKERFRRNEMEEDQDNFRKKLLKKLKVINFNQFRDVTYVYVIIGSFFAELSLILCLTYFSSYAVAQGNSTSTALLLLTIWNASGVLGRWLPGYISDFYGKFNINILMLLGFNISIFVMWLPFGHKLNVLYAYAALGGYFLGSILSMLPACLSQISPVSQFGERYGNLMFALSIGNLVGVPIGASVIDKNTVQDYDHYVILVGVIATLGTVFWFLSRYKLVGLKLNVKV